jgi:integrase/recombinase XerD
MELAVTGRGAKTRHLYGSAVVDTLTRVASHQGVVLDELDLASIVRSDVIRALHEWQSAVDPRYTRRPEAAPNQRAARTVEARIGALKRFFAWTVTADLLMLDPVDGLPVPRRGRHLPNAHTVPNALRLFRAAELSSWPSRDGAIVAILLGSGPRLNEVAGLHLDDVICDGEGIPVALVLHGKGDRERRVPLTPRAQAALLVYLAERDRSLARWEMSSNWLWVPIKLVGHRRPGPPRMTRDGIGDLLSRLHESAGIAASGKRVHVCRGTAATAMIGEGVGVRTVQEVLGHADLATTALYLAVTDGDRVAAVRANPLG